jgi:hypothetical protein
MDKQVARYVHLQNPDTTEIWDGGVLPEILFLHFCPPYNLSNSN